MSVGDGRASTVDGIGRVDLRMDDGVIRSIQCLHVPGMKTCFISLSTLDSQGFRYHARRGVLKVCRGRETYMRGRLAGGQYILLGSVMSGGASAGEFEGINFTRSWHRWLGHESDAEL